MVSSEHGGWVPNKKVPREGEPAGSQTIFTASFEKSCGVTSSPLDSQSRPSGLTQAQEEGKQTAPLNR